MAKFDKEITLFPKPYKAVKLRVSDENSFAECDKLLRDELVKYRDLLDAEDLEILDKILEE